ncbi:putative efflux protein, MATE family [Peptoniphilus asaccharolyticus DSM 20463]|uniref:Multidrug export protein MepA n=1 Tax=Peptoniphilus asaccharolyticus DSM 20463 TaxID=573058 RepID=A0A1W1V586_PEPAS|nr:MATE family efflux transporter [Peptoniphilus asaccharolyticus]MBL7576295.1 MATE family efflux transporter [Peptoniphilus asaccharolyticus]SMB88134.1 putative efflux protein, MATE family [Peptoniphilus asaccharolyticus DSM 20463]
MKLSEHFTYKKLIKFCMPSIVMMLFTSFYVVVDGLFVSNFVGKTSFAAINIIIPFLLMVGGFGFMIGTGGSALVSKTLGEKKNSLANDYFSMLIWFSIALGIVLSIVGIVFLKDISLMLGATESMLQDCIVYGRIILLFNISYMLQNIFQTFLVTAEKPGLGLKVTVFAGVTNMVLDFIFITIFKRGVAGAAIATGISQSVGTIIPLIYFMYNKDGILNLKRTRIEWHVIAKSCSNGMSEMLTSVSTSVVGMLYNIQLLKFAGENGVAAGGAIMYVQFIFISAYIGYDIGTAPLIGYNYGAKNHNELKSLLRKSFILISISGVLLMVSAQLGAVSISKIFVGYDLDLLDMMVSGFRIFALSFMIVGFNTFISSFFTALNNGVVSAINSFMRTFILQVVFVLLLPSLYGLDGIWWATNFAEIGSILTGIFFIVALRKNYNYF